MMAEKGTCKVSVIIPYYNAEKYIEKCLSSVAEQTLDNIEVIAVNDGSTDSSQSIVQNFCSQYKNIISIQQTNQRQGAARNNGMQRAKGKYIYFLDADDYIAPVFLEKCYDAAQYHKCDIVTVSTKPFSSLQNNTKIMADYSRTLIPNKVQIGKEYFKYTQNNNEFYVTPWIYFYNHEFLRKNSLRFLEGIIYEDTPFNFVAINQADSIIYVNNAIHYHRIHTESTMQRCISNLNLYSNLKGIRRMNDYINDKLKAGETVEKEQVNFLQWAVATQNTLLAETKKRDDVTHEIMNEYRKFLRENRYLKSTIFYKYKCKAMFIKGKKAIKKQETLKYD